jgi:uncharacterized protein
VPLAIVEQPFRIANASGDWVSGDLRFPAGISPLPVVVICHGFTAFKDWGPFPYFGRRFAEHGFATVTFNFSHNGIGENPRRFTEFEKFSRNTIGKELEDLRAVVDAVVRGRLGDGHADATRIAVVGHSRGGAIGILGAAEDPRINAVAGWATVASVHRYTDHQRELWERQGFLPVKVRSAHTRLRFGVEVLRDLEANRERYDLLRAMRRLQVPVLIVHGKADVSVRPDEAQRLFEAGDPSRTQLVLLDHVGHTFGAKHPFSGHHPAVDHVIDMTAQWFTLHL